MKPTVCIIALLVLKFASTAGACVEAISEHGGEIQVEVALCTDILVVGQEFQFELRVTNNSAEPVRLLRDLGSVAIPIAVAPDGQELIPNCLPIALPCDKLLLDSTVLLEPGSFYGQTLNSGAFASEPGVYKFYVNLFIQGCHSWGLNDDLHLKSAAVSVVVEG